MTAPAISIVLPVFNGAKYLGETLASVYAQTYDDWELLLIDDGSTDASAALMRTAANSDRRVCCLEHPNRENRGTLATRILGAKHAQSAIIALIDQDDLWSERYLEDHLALWRNSDGPLLGLSYGPAIYWHPDGKTEDYVQPMPLGSPGMFRPGDLLQSFLATGYANTPCPCCTFIRREALLAAERFASAAYMSHCEDQYLWWSVALRWEVMIYGPPLARYRQHAESALATLINRPDANQSIETFLELIAADVAQVRSDHPVLADLAARIRQRQPGKPL